MKKLIFCIVIFFIHNSNFTSFKAQAGIHSSIGLKSSALSGISSTLQGIDAIYHNPAGLIQQHNTSIDLSYHNFYGLSSFNALGIGVILPYGNSTFSCGITQYGVEEFKSQRLQLMYGRQLNKQFAIGIGFHYNRISIQEYGSKGQMNLTIGIQSIVQGQLRIGTCIYNAVQYRSTDIINPLIINIGCGYRISSKVELTLEIQKIAYAPMSPKIGLEYNPYQKLQMMMGIDIEKTAYGFGMKYQYHNFKISFGFTKHQQLDGSYGMSFQWEKNSQ